MSWVLGSSLLTMLRFIKLKLTVAESHHFSKNLKNPWFLRSLWASFGNHLLCFSVIDLLMICWLVFLKLLSIWIPKMASRFAYFNTFFVYLFDPVLRGCLWRSLRSFWLPFGLHLDCFGYSFGSVLASLVLVLVLNIPEARPDIGFEHFRQWKRTFLRARCIFHYCCIIVSRIDFTVFLIFVSWLSIYVMTYFYCFPGRISILRHPQKRWPLHYF